MSDRRDAPDDQRAPPPQPTSERETDDELTGILKATQLNFVLPKILGFSNFSGRWFKNRVARQRRSMR